MCLWLPVSSCSLIEEKIPLKQGLKQPWPWQIYTEIKKIEEKIPLKQGLKL